MSYNILIAEDDVFISEHLKQILINIGYNVSGIVASYDQTLSFLSKNKPPDLALLDIQMHGKDQGVEIAKHLNSVAIPFIFITSFNDKNTVQKAVEQAPKGYIIKPFSKEEIQQIVTQTLAANGPKFLYLKNKLATTKIEINDIFYLKSDNVYVEIYTKKNRFVHRSRLSKMIEKLPKNIFVRVHQSYVVNKSHISQVSPLSLTILKEKIPISKKYRGAVLSF